MERPSKLQLKLELAEVEQLAATLKPGLFGCLRGSRRFLSSRPSSKQRAARS
jgi:hypothetical protein